MGMVSAMNNTAALSLGFICGFWSGGVLAANDWKLQSGVSIEERYTDNLSLSSGGGSGSFVTSITPRANVAHKGKRGNVTVDYNLNALVYDHDPKRNKLNHNLNASLSVDPVVGILQLKGSARVGQQFASQFGPTSQDTYHTTSNRVETRSLSLTPSLHNEFFQRNLITDASLALNHASSDGSALSTSTSNVFNFTAKNGPRPGRVTYAATFRRSGGQSNGVPSSVFESESFNIGYVIYYRTRLFVARGGNKTKGVATLDGKATRYQTTGFSWSPSNSLTFTGTAGSDSGGSMSSSVSAEWTPNRRLSLSATAGKRRNSTAYSLSGNWTPSPITTLSGTVQKNFSNTEFGVGSPTVGLSNYGTTAYAFTLSHRLRRSGLSLNYSETVTEAAQQLNNVATSAFYLCPNGAGGFTVEATQIAPDCVTASTQIPATQLLNETTLQKTWAGTYNYSLGRSAISFTFSQARREFLSTGTTLLGTLATGTTRATSDLLTTYSIRYNLPLSTRTVTSFGSAWTQATAAELSSDSWAIDWSLAHQISQHVSSSLSARHSEQSSNTGTSKENSIAALLGITF